MDIEVQEQLMQIGYFKIEELSLGEYEVIESNSGSNYVSNPVPYKVTVIAGTTQTLRITNNRKTGAIRLIKVDSRDNRTPISGCTFEVYSSEDDYQNKIATATTSSAGIIEFSNLRVGYTYKIREVSSNEWYVLDSTDRELILNDETQSDIIITNRIKTAQIKVVKMDVDYNEFKLENVEFQIYEDTNKNGKVDIGEKVVDTIITNSQGIAISRELPIDKEYIVLESKTKDDYHLNTTTQKVTFTPADYKRITTLTFTNKKKEGQIHLTKVDLDNHNVLLGHVSFMIYSEELKSWIKYNDNTKIWDRTSRDDKDAIYYSNVNAEIFWEHLRVRKLPNFRIRNK